MDLIRDLTDLVGQIPRGRLTTFHDLASALGDPDAALAVFRILRETPMAGAHRVVRTSGEIPKPSNGAKLRGEGIRVSRGFVSQPEAVSFRAFRSGQPLARLRDEQRRLAKRVREADDFESAEYVAGFDLAYAGDRATAAAVVVRRSRGGVVQTARAIVPVSFPYIPGYLAYREFPGIERCYDLLDPKPDVLMIDGHGTLHPARFGIACYVGLSLDRPTIGVAKNLLVGDAGPAPRHPGGVTEIRVDGELRGFGLRTSRSRRLRYVSVGHRISLATAVKLTKTMCRTRMSDPLGQAHSLAKI
ncbi:MAG TPA: endonuclease V [Thermoplasmata archaeon]|nr:endonuclease V [Thermoplasmata archaeon]